MSRTVVVAGEALIDLTPGPDGALRPLLGGGPFNTARALGRLGQAATFLGLLSRDALGRRLAAALAEDGVQVGPGLETDLNTSLAMAELDAAGRAAYRFYFRGTSAEALTPDLALAALPADPAALHVGSLGLVLHPLADAVEALVRRCAGRSLVMVDPNVRPAATSDAAAYAARLSRVIAQSDVLKVSEEDLQVLRPGEPPLDAARAFLTRGPKLVLLTLGPDGAVACGAFGTRAVPSPRVEVADTIGAGDAFSGAWLAGWLERRPSWTDGDAVAAVTAFACRAAALSCRRPGASPPTRAEITAQDDP